MEVRRDCLLEGSEEKVPQLWMLLDQFNELCNVPANARKRGTREKNNDQRKGGRVGREENSFFL